MAGPNTVIHSRLLLSHSSGISYDIMDPKLMQWRKSLGQEAMTLCGSIVRLYEADHKGNIAYFHFYRMQGIECL